MSDADTYPLADVSGVYHAFARKIRFRKGTGFSPWCISPEQSISRQEESKNKSKWRPHLQCRKARKGAEMNRVEWKFTNGYMNFWSFRLKRKKKNTSEDFHLFRKLSSGMSCTIWISNRIFQFLLTNGERSSFLCIRYADEYGKRDRCHGSKLTELSMRGGYLATESSHDTSLCVDSRNNSGISLKEYMWQSACPSYSQQTYHGACGFKSAVWGWVIVKKSSPKNLSVDCRSTDYRQVTNRLRTANWCSKLTAYQHDSRPTDGRQSTDRFFGELFFTITQGCGQQLDQSEVSTHGRGLFSRTRQPSEYKRETSAGCRNTEIFIKFK